MAQWDMIELLSRLIEYQQAIISRIDQLGTKTVWLSLGLVAISSSAPLFGLWLYHRFSISRDKLKLDREKEIADIAKLRAIIEEAFALVGIVSTQVKRAILINERDAALEVARDAHINRDMIRLGSLLNVYFPDVVDSFGKAVEAYSNIFDRYSMFWSAHDPRQPASPEVNDVMHPYYEEWDLRLIDLYNALEPEIMRLRPGQASNAPPAPIPPI